MPSPLSHLIAFGLLAWWGRWLFRSNPSGPQRQGAAALLVVFTCWVLVSSALAYRAVYLSHNDPWMPVLWGTAAPFVLIGVSAALSRGVRLALIHFVRTTPLPALVGIHAIRILALGTIVKGWKGVLPTHFIVPVALPDFTIGLTAFALALGLARAPTRWRGVAIAWSVAGALVLMSAPLWMQLSQPGPFRRFYGGPNTDEVLGFPMSIVPTFIGPFFVALHGAALYRLLGTTKEIQ